MRDPPPLPILVSPRQHAILYHLAHCPTAPHALVQRARLLLAATDGAANDAIARQLGLHRQAVCRWRARWHAAHALLAAQEAADPAAAPLRTFITDLLDDAPRCGTPPTFTPEQVV